MKSPTEIAARLAKQWHQPLLRAERLLSVDSWPLEFRIGKPTGSGFVTNTALVHAHVKSWQQVTVGEVVWENVKFRGGAEPISIPVRWCIRTPSEWVDASADLVVQQEFHSLESFVGNVSEIYWEALVRDRSIWRNKSISEVIATAELADSLFPRAAKGRPLRLLAGMGVDTKFFERNGSLLTRLLDERFQGQASEQGLHVFLDAYDDNDHWVLVAPLDSNLLPFLRQRITTRELSETILPGSRVLVIENEHCFHLLPKLPATVAILGAGLDLQWLGSRVFDGKAVAYWGDLDTWGLLMLSRARQYRANLTPLLMEQRLFDSNAEASAVAEPVIAQNEPPASLSEDEQKFYMHLLDQKKGRLEQEYLPQTEIHKVLLGWLGGLEVMCPEV